MYVEIGASIPAKASGSIRPKQLSVGARRATIGGASGRALERAHRRPMPGLLCRPPALVPASWRRRRQASARHAERNQAGPDIMQGEFLGGRGGDKISGLRLRSSWREIEPHARSACAKKSARRKPGCMAAHSANSDTKLSVGAFALR